jgi:methionyl aminopeptidase
MIPLKDEKAVGFMRECAQIVSDVHRLLQPHVTVGTSLNDLDTIAEEYIRSQNAKPAFKGYPSGVPRIPAFPATLCISLGNEVVHGIPGKQEIQQGDIVSIDVGVEKNGYFGDGAMTHLVQDNDPEKLRLLEVTKESLYRGLDQAVAGKRLFDISASIQEYVEENGFSVVRDLVGHGIGEKLHEEPQVPNFGVHGKGPVLMSGMTLAIEPMVNYGDFEIRVEKNGWTITTKDRKPSAHFEHTVLITDNGPEILTNHFSRTNG